MTTPRLGSTVLALAVGLASWSTGGCGTPGPSPPPTTAPLRAAIVDALPVLTNHEPETAAAWRDWLARNRAKDLLAVDPPELEIETFPGVFEATAYAAPVLDARRTADPDHRHAILGPPPPIPAADLPTRREYHAAPDSRPPVLGWIANGLDAYLAEVNGSVALRFPDGERVCLDWVRTNERPYTSLGRRLVEEGHLEANRVTLDAIRTLHDREPRLVEELMLDNDRVVYFRTIPCDDWPEASTGVRLRPRYAAAVDPSTIALGSVLIVTRADGTRMLATAIDTGGAIVGRRIDLFLGFGDEALREAGGVVESVRVRVLRPATE